MRQSVRHARQEVCADVSKVSEDIVICVSTSLQAMRTVIPQ